MINTEDLKPKIGDFVHPIREYFHISNFTDPLAFRGFLTHPSIPEFMINELRKLQSPEDLDGAIIEKLAHMAALNPNNRPDSFTIGGWDIDYSKRRNYWLNEFRKIQDGIMESAKNNWEMANRRFKKLEDILAVEDLDDDSVELAVGMYKFVLL